MCRCAPGGGRHRRRRVGHGGGGLELALNLAALAASLLLCACVGGTRVDVASTSASALVANGASSGPRASMVEHATAMLGQPYRFGGAAPGGFDCSGLVVYAAAGAGIRVPRTAAEQRRWGAAVRRPDLQPGDLVFMHLAHKELHVGIALDRSRFIHAPSTGGRVRIDDLGAAPYAAGYIGARRMIAAR